MRTYAEVDKAISEAENDFSRVEVVGDSLAREAAICSNLNKTMDAVVWAATIYNEYGESTGDTVQTAALRARLQSLRDKMQVAWDFRGCGPAPSNDEDDD